MIEKYLKYVKIFNIPSKEITFWIGHNLKNYLETNTENQGEIEHILDYLANKRSKRLKKMSYKQALSNTNKWMKSLAKKGKNIEEIKGKDFEIVLDFKDGFKIVKLKSKNSYEREGNLMSNCVSTYFDKDDDIFSLRDKNNMPHCTMSKSSQQIKGKGNGKIYPKYIGYILEFLEFSGIETRISELINLGNKIEGIYEHNKNRNEFYKLNNNIFYEVKYCNNKIKKVNKLTVKQVHEGIKKEFSKLLIKNSKPLNLDLFELDFFQKILTVNVNNVEINLENFNYFIIKAGDDCVINAGSWSTIIVGSGNTINEKGASMVKCSTSCLINLNNGSTINADSICTVNAGRVCIIKVGNMSTVNSGEECIIDTGCDCEINTKNNCIIKCSCLCEIKTGDSCNITSWRRSTIIAGKETICNRADVFDFFEVPNNIKIKLNDYKVKGYKKIK